MFIENQHFSRMNGRFIGSRTMTMATTNTGRPPVNIKPFSWGNVFHMINVVALSVFANVKYTRLYNSLQGEVLSSRGKLSRYLKRRASLTTEGVMEIFKPTKVGTYANIEHSVGLVSFILENHLSYS